LFAYTKKIRRRGKDPSPPFSQMKENHWIYILEVENGKLYTGYTKDMKRRICEHLSGKRGARFTRAFHPKSVLQSWKLQGSRGIAMRVEHFVKSMTRTRKIKLIEHPETLQELLYREKMLSIEITPCPPDTEWY
jgi:putative endonuclease